MSDAARSAKIGMLYAVGAYTTWGFVPLFWRELKMFMPLHILAHRILWSLLFFFVIFSFQRSLKTWFTASTNKQILRKCGPSALAIGLNWGLYIFAVNSGHAIEASLGYFINPIFNVLIGAFVFHETLNRRQWTAFTFAFCGVALLTVLNGRLPWIALALAGTFSAYGVIRKKTAIRGTTGTAVESLLLVPVALLILSSPSLSPTSLSTLPDPIVPGILLSLGGALTALPLVWFAEAAQRLPMSTLGFFQYISPTFQFLIAVLIFKEPFDSAKMIAFILIWIGLAIFVFDSAKNHLQERSAPSRAST